MFYDAVSNVLRLGRVVRHTHERAGALCLMAVNDGLAAGGGLGPWLFRQRELKDLGLEAAYASVCLSGGASALA